MNSIRYLASSLDALYSKDETSSKDIPLPNEDTAEAVNDANFDDILSEPEPEVEIPAVTADPSHTSLATADDSMRSLFFSILEVLYFVPRHCIVRPLLIIWLVVTYPITYTLEQLGISRASPNSIDGYDQVASFDSDLAQRSLFEIDEKNLLYDSTEKNDEYDEKNNDYAKAESDMGDSTAALKQESILSNDIKSPTTCGKYIIPPPQRLYPLSRNPNKIKRKKTLILDLDETLIHSLLRGSPRLLRSSSGSQPRTIEIRLNNLSCLYYVHKRPFCDFFLREASKWFDLQIFTASVKEYADPIVDWLENDLIDHRAPGLNGMSDPLSRAGGRPAAPRLFSRRYYRHDCTLKENVGYIKDLSRFFPKEDDLKNVIILDNSPVSYALHGNNGILIEGWINDHADRELLNMLPLLHSLSLCIDVRYILGLKVGEKIFDDD